MRHEGTEASTSSESRASSEFMARRHVVERASPDFGRNLDYEKITSDYTWSSMSRFLSLNVTSSSAVVEKPRCSVGQFWVGGG